MTSIGIRELKNKLSEYLDRVEKGQRVTVTKRSKIKGKPVADTVIEERR